MKRATLSALCLCVLLSSASAVAGPWEQFSSQKYGFSMLVQKGTKLRARDMGGWGALVAEHKPVTLLAMARLGEKASPREIEAFGQKITGIDGKHWKAVDSGSGVNGWQWYRAAAASDGKRMVAARNRSPAAPASS